MYAAAAARSAVHREVDQYEDDNVGTQALSEGEKAAEKCPRYFQEPLRQKAEKESQDAGQERLQNRKIFPAEADCSTRCRRIRHRRGQFQLAFPVAAEAGHPAKATMPPPGRAQRHRPQAAKRHPMAPLPQSPAWSRSSTKENRWSAPQSTALPILQKATRTFF